MPSIARQILRLVYRRVRSWPVAFPHRVECNVCGWHGRRFLNNKWHAGSVCPICNSQIRHRLLVAAWSNIDQVSYARIIRHKRILHFGPEAYITALVRPYTDHYVTADYLRHDVDLRLDISDMPEVIDNSYDVVIACDVLEHVVDDSAAMTEMFRILKSGGWAIVTVPQEDNREETFEDKSVTDPRERERIFGQVDHLRIYGRSFPRLLAASGFSVTTIDEHNFDAQLIERHMLFPLKLSTRPRVTNFRKVFFAQKP